MNSELEMQEFLGQADKKQVVRGGKDMGGKEARFCRKGGLNLQRKPRIAKKAAKNRVPLRGRRIVVLSNVPKS